MDEENKFSIVAGIDMLINGYADWMRRSGCGEDTIKKEIRHAKEEIVCHLISNITLDSIRTTDPVDRSKFVESINRINMNVSKARRLIDDNRVSLADILEQISANGTDVNDPDSVQVFHWVGDRSSGSRHSCGVKEYKRHHSADTIPVDCVSVTEDGLVCIDVAPEDDRRE